MYCSPFQGVTGKIYTANLNLPGVFPFLDPVFTSTGFLVLSPENDDEGDSFGTCLSPELFLQAKWLSWSVNEGNLPGDGSTKCSMIVSSDSKGPVSLS